MPSGSIGWSLRALDHDERRRRPATPSPAAHGATGAAPLDQRVRRAAQRERGEHARRRRRTAPGASGSRVSGTQRWATTTVDHRERQVDQEDPAPVGVLHEARRRRTGRSPRRCCRARTRRRSPGRGRRGAKAPWIIARLPGVSSAAPTPCRIRAAISDLGRGREAAQQRGEREPHGADDEDPAPAEPVAERAAEQDQAGEREQVAVGDPLQLGQARVEVLADGAQRDVDDGAVEQRHPRAEDGRQRPPPGRGADVPQPGLR